MLVPRYPIIEEFWLTSCYSLHDIVLPFLATLRRVRRIQPRHERGSGLREAKVHKALFDLFGRYPYMFDLAAEDVAKFLGYLQTNTSTTIWRKCACIT